MGGCGTFITSECQPPHSLILIKKKSVGEKWLWGGQHINRYCCTRWHKCEMGEEGRLFLCWSLLTSYVHVCVHVPVHTPWSCACVYLHSIWSRSSMVILAESHPLVCTSTWLLIGLHASQSCIYSPTVQVTAFTLADLGFHVLTLVHIFLCLCSYNISKLNIKAQAQTKRTSCLFFSLKKMPPLPHSTPLF